MTSSYPYQRQLTRKLFTVDSEDRIEGTDTKFVAVLDMPHTNSFNSVCLLNAEIDKTWYLIEGDEVLPVTVGGTADSISFLPGNYSAGQLATSLEAELNALSLGVFTVDFDSQTLHFTIDHTTEDFTIDFTNRLLSKYFGFEPQLYSSSSQSLTSAKVAILQKYQSLTLRSSVGLNNNNDLLCTIFPNSALNNGGVISYSCFDTIASSVGLVDRNSNRFNFSLVDESTNLPVQLNGGHIRLSICLSAEKQ